MAIIYTERSTTGRSKRLSDLNDDPNGGAIQKTTDRSKRRSNPNNWEIHTTTEQSKRWGDSNNEGLIETTERFKQRLSYPKDGAT